jgi:hypothetical protein
MPKPKRPYAPPQDSLAWRVCDYLRANPGEELMRGDVATKFNVSPAAIDGELQPAVSAHMLERVQTDDSGVVWRLRAQSRGSFPRPFSSSVASARRAIRSHQLIDISAFVIEKDVPLTDPVKRVNQWGKLFDRMELGDSFQVPNEVRMALAHAQAKYRKTTGGVIFAIRKVSDSHTRIWRTA